MMMMMMMMKTGMMRMVERLGERKKQSTSY